MANTATAPSPTAAESKVGTEYVVLRQGFDDDVAAPVWYAVGTPVAAPNKEDAIKAAVARLGELQSEPVEGIFKAVPTRSWRGSVSIQTERVVKTTATVIED